jgi:hypothetical protein
MTVTSPLVDPQLTVAEVVSRLITESAAQIPRSAVAEMVGQCLADLQPVSAAALPEMLERLARHRLEKYLRDPSLWLN